MKKRNVMAIYRSRLKLAISANCRSPEPSRKKGMLILASEVGVFSNAMTLEPDLLCYVEQVKRPSQVKNLLSWAREIGKGKSTIDDMPKLPHFQLELM